MQRLEVSCAVRHMYMSLDAKGLIIFSGGLLCTFVKGGKFFYPLNNNFFLFSTALVSGVMTFLVFGTVIM